jgi:hypothetical protein
MQFRVQRLIFEILCVIHREPDGGVEEGGGSSGKKDGFWMKAR